MKHIAKTIILIAVLLLGFASGIQYDKRTRLCGTCQCPSLTVAPAKPVQLMLDYGNGKIDTYSMDLTKDTSVFELLQKSSQEKNIELKFKDYGGEMGVFVEAIGGIENNIAENKYWQYWVNNNYAQVGPSQQILQTGDVIQWKFIQGQFK